MITNQANIEQRGNSVKVIISTIGQRGPQGPPGEGMYSFDTLQEAQDKWASFSQEEKDELEGKEYVISDKIYKWTAAQPQETDYVRDILNVDNMKSVELVNSVQNGDFSQDSDSDGLGDGWEKGSEITGHSIVNGMQQWIATSNSFTGRISQPLDLKAGHFYFVSFKYTNVSRFLFGVTGYQPTETTASGTYNGIIQADGNYNQFSVPVHTSNSYSSIGEIVIVDLTKSLNIKSIENEQEIIDKVKGVILSNNEGNTFFDSELTLMNYFDLPIELDNIKSDIGKVENDIASINSDLQAIDLTNTVQNGDFSQDSDSDGLGDDWIKGSNVDENYITENTQVWKSSSLTLSGSIWQDLSTPLIEGRSYYLHFNYEYINDFFLGSKTLTTPDIVSGTFSGVVQCDDASVSRLRFAPFTGSQYSKVSRVILLDLSDFETIPSTDVLENIFRSKLGYPYYFDSLRVTRLDFPSGSGNGIVAPVGYKDLKSSAINTIVAGSSITWGNGLMSELLSGELMKAFISRFANSVLQNEVKAEPSSTIFENKKMFEGHGVKISGIGSKLTFKLASDEINICQAIQRTHDYADVIVRADGQQVLSFHNKNHTYLPGMSQSFVADGVTGQFKLNHPHTYNHQLTIDGVSHPIITKRYDHASYPWGNPPDYNAVVLRTWDDENEEVVHSILFHEDDIPPSGAEIIVTYDTGKVITMEDSTVGERDTDNEIERPYGIGGTQYDPLEPANITSGMEFRSLDKNAFQTYKFDEFKEREYEIEIVGGVNPYFIFNYAVGKLHRLSNMGVGGFGVENYISSTPIFNMDYPHFFKWGKPDVIFIQGGLSGDTARGDRKVKRIVENETEATAKSVPLREVDQITYVSPDNYTIRYCSGIIDSITKTSLKSAHILGTDVAVGDYLRIGNYYGDNRSVAIRKITSVDIEAGEIGWDLPLFPENILNIESVQDLVGAEFSVRDLVIYKERLQTFIEGVRSIYPDTKFVVVTSENSNWWTRQSWGYQILYWELVNDYPNVDIVRTEEWFEEKVNNWISGNTYEEIIADGSEEYVLSIEGNYQGFKVIIDGEDVYGKDCVVRIGRRYGVPQSQTGSQISVDGIYQGVNITEPLKLIFLKNKPAAGTQIKVVYADGVWAGDLTHMTPISAKMYAQLYADKIANL